MKTTVQQENAPAAKSTSDLVARVQEIEERARQRAQKAKPVITPLPARLVVKLVHFPPWPEISRGTPNAWLRCALFAAIHGKQRRALQRELLASVDGMKIRFTGWQLDQSDLDVWETVVHLLRHEPLGISVEFTAHAILKALGRSNGKAQHQWLKNVIARLYSAGIEITVGNQTYFGTLFKGSRNETTGRYVIEVERELLRMYEAGWTQINWEERQRLRRKPLALWLHGWYSTHAKPYPMKVETFRRLCGSNNKDVADFRRRLRNALSELKEAEVITDFKLDDDKVYIDRTPSPSQQRHLMKRAAKRKG